MTWGALKSMSWQFYRVYAEEAYAVLSKDFVERITFVLDGKREYQLLCRYRAGDDEPACAALGSSFRLR